MAKLNVRAIISLSLLFLIIILFITAVGIQILDELIPPETLIEMYLNPEGTSSFLVELLGVTKAIHVIAGFLFCGLTIIHVIKNWNAIKSYLKKRWHKEYIHLMNIIWEYQYSPKLFFT